MIWHGCFAGESVTEASLTFLSLMVHFLRAESKMVPQFPLWKMYACVMCGRKCVCVCFALHVICIKSAINQVRLVDMRLTSCVQWVAHWYCSGHKTTKKKKEEEVALFLYVTQNMLRHGGTPEVASWCCSCCSHEDDRGKLHWTVRNNDGGCTKPC